MGHAISNLGEVQMRKATKELRWTQILLALKLCGIIKGNSGNTVAQKLLRRSGRAKRVGRGRYQLRSRAVRNAR